MSAVLRWTGRVLLWAVMLALVLVVGATVAVPRLAGAQTYAVLSPSMEPTLPPGTLVVVRPAPVVAVGDVVTYQVRSGEPTVITHRVVAQVVGTDGGSAYRLRGDANDAEDPEPVRPGQIRGRAWYAVPLAGYVSTWLSGDRRVLIIGIGASALVAYAMVQLIGRGRRS